MAGEVRDIFDSIAPRYDLLNRLLSAGLDRRWRRRLAREIRPSRPARVLDLATGTAELAIAAAGIGARLVVGIDPSAAMLSIARRKLRRRAPTGAILFVRAAAEDLPFPSASFDAAIVAFGVRNFADPGRGLAEARRILRPGGVLAILEFSLPEEGMARRAYLAYFRRFLPAIGDLLSRRPGAYRHLRDSALEFPRGPAFGTMLARAGFRDLREVRLTRGIVSLWVGRAPASPRA